MSLALTPTSSTRINSNVRGAVYLVEMDFTTGNSVNTIRYTNAPVNIPAGGKVFIGLNNLVGISNMTESEANSAEKMTFSFSVVNQAMLALTLGGVDTYRGKPIRMYLQLMDQNFQPDGAPIRRWSGYMDRVQISRQKSSPDGGGSTGKIEMICSRSGMARARNYQGLRLTHTQHQHTNPGDNGLEYMQNLIEQPSTWLSKKFQTQ